MFEEKNEIQNVFFPLYSQQQNTFKLLIFFKIHKKKM